MRRRGGRDIGQVANVSPRCLRHDRGVEIQIEIESRSPFTGSVRAGQAAAPFVGWLSLLAMLERLVASLEAAPRGLGGELDAGGDVELAQRAGDVGADGAPRQVEALGDLGVRASLRE